MASNEKSFQYNFKNPSYFYLDENGFIKQRFLKLDEETGSYIQIYFCPWANQQHKPVGLAIGFTVNECAEKAAMIIWQKVKSGRKDCCSYRNQMKEKGWYALTDSSRPFGIYASDETVAQTLKMYLRLRLLAMGVLKTHESIDELLPFLSYFEDVIRENLQYFPDYTRRWNTWIEKPLLEFLKGDFEEFPCISEKLFARFNSIELFGQDPVLKIRTNQTADAKNFSQNTLLRNPMIKKKKNVCTFKPRAQRSIIRKKLQNEKRSVAVEWLKKNLQKKFGYDILISKVFNFYLSYCEKNRFRPTTCVLLSKYLRSIFTKVEMIRLRRAGCTGGYYYSNFTFKETSEYFNASEDVPASIDNNHPINQWLLENFEENRNSKIYVDVIYNLYITFCSISDAIPVKKYILGRHITKVFPNRTSAANGLYSGFSLKIDSPLKKDFNDLSNAESENKKRDSNAELTGESSEEEEEQEFPARGKRKRKPIQFIESDSSDDSDKSYKSSCPMKKSKSNQTEMAVNKNSSKVKCQKKKLTEKVAYSADHIVAVNWLTIHFEESFQSDVKASHIYNLYVNYCVESQYREMSKSVFGRKVKFVFENCESKKIRTSSRPIGHYYCGIGFKLSSPLRDISQDSGISLIDENDHPNPLKKADNSESEPEDNVTVPEISNPSTSVKQNVESPLAPGKTFKLSSPTNLTKSDEIKLLREGFESISKNSYCVECDTEDPQCVSCSMGTYLCFSCAQLHLKLGVPSDPVKNVKKSSFTVSEIKIIIAGGNQKSREKYEGKLVDSFRKKLVEKSIGDFILFKYETE